MSKMALAMSAVWISGAIVAFPAVAASPADPTQEIADALLKQDFVSAEQRIAGLGPEASKDAVMLINLGNAYAGMGRRADAQLAYRAAIAAEPDVELDLADGSVRTVRDVATEAIDRLGVSYAGR